GLDEVLLFPVGLLATAPPGEDLASDLLEGSVAQLAMEAPSARARSLLGRPQEDVEIGARLLDVQPRLWESAEHVELSHWLESLDVCRKPGPAPVGRGDAQSRSRMTTGISRVVRVWYSA